MFGAAIGAAMITPRLTGAMLGSISGAVDFVTMAALIGGAENFLPRTRLGKALERAPFLAVFGLKAIAYSTVILAVVGGRLGSNVTAFVVGRDLALLTNLDLDTKLPLGLIVPTAFLTG